MVAYSTAPADWPMGTEAAREILVLPKSWQVDGRAVAGAYFITNLLAIPIAKGVLIPSWEPPDSRAMHGLPIGDVRDRGNLLNPVPTRFVEDLQRQLNASIARDPQLVRQRFRNPVWVAGGRAALVEQKGSGEPLLQFNLLLTIYRHPDNGAFGATHVVDCSVAKGPARTLAQWSQGGSYLPLKRSLDQALTECQQRVVAQTKALMDIPTAVR